MPFRCSRIVFELSLYLGNNLASLAPGHHLRHVSECAVGADEVMGMSCTTALSSVWVLMLCSEAQDTQNKYESKATWRVQL